jgi:hypothetical protein
MGFISDMFFGKSPLCCLECIGDNDFGSRGNILLVDVLNDFRMAETPRMNDGGF